MSAAGVPDSNRLIASLPVAVVLLEPGQRIALVNPAAEQFFQRSSRKLSGLVLDEVLKFLENYTARLIEDVDMPVSAREVAVVVEGVGPRKVDLAASPVADMPGWQLLVLNDHISVQGYAIDSGGAAGAMLRGPEILAHEIKNPLAGIKGAAQLLSRKLDSADHALTDLITSEVDRIAKLIEQMQVLSGKTVPPVAACNLHLLVRNAIAVIEVAASGGSTPTITEEFDPSLPEVLGSGDGLVQVFINLLANAREACVERPDAKIIVRTRFASGLQAYSDKSDAPVRLPVEVRISDNGPGVPVELREHIFEPFVTSKKTGQGLGLALVRKIVRDMNGRISHERDETLGLTHFRVHLPIATGADDRIANPRVLP